MTARNSTQAKRCPFKGNSAESLKFRYKLAQNIKVECARRSLMTSDLAERVGMTRARISDIVHSNGAALAHEVMALAKELGITTDELMKGCVE